MCINIKNNQNRIQALAYHDSLTGLPNRNMFHDFLQQTLMHAQRENEKFAVLFLDIDEFKRVNDTLGHDAGDILLCEVARRLKSTLRGEDYIAKTIEEQSEGLIARLGGDEFIIIISNIKESSAAAVAAERIIKVLKEPLIIEEQKIYVTFSIGITLYPDDGISPDLLIKHSDIAMYEAKKEGKNTYRFYSQEMNERVLSKFSIENKLHKAIKDDEFYICYQPIFDVNTRKIVSLEALIRWNNRDASINTPDIFIPIAEEVGLVIEIDKWMINQVCKQIKKWQIAGFQKVPVSVNISNNHFSHEGLYEFISKCIAEADINSKYLILEMTETAIMGRYNEVKELLKRMKKLGIQIALDDFGTGYSSFDVLRRLPIDILKIDKCFIDEISKEKNHDKIISAMILMGRSLDMKIVVEGVEQKNQLQYLEMNNCDYAQGFLLGMPISANEVVKLFKQEDYKIA